MKKLLFVFAAATAVAASAATFEELRARCEKKVSSLTLDEKCRLLMNAAPEVKHAGISAYDWWNEALHGVGRHVRSTMFPMPIGMAASFDPELIREVGDAISTEARIIHKTAVDRNYHGRYSGLTFWSPNVNIFRDFRRVPVKAGATVEASFDVPAKLLVEYAEDGVAKPAAQISYSIGL